MTPVEILDAAYERLARWGFDEPDNFVNHAPMTCEALATLGRLDQVDAWSRIEIGTNAAVPRSPGPGFDWRQALGEIPRADEWIGLFEREIAEHGWSAVLHTWLPRLLPGMSAALFHGMIRSAHATRSITNADTTARRAELARSLGYWAAYWSPGATPAEPDKAPDTGHNGAVRAAAVAARRYITKPNIIHLHGITAAMAASILLDHTDEPTARAAVAQLRADQDDFTGRTPPITRPPVPTIDETTLIAAAIASGEAHAVKLVEACHRGYKATADPVLLAAAERACRRGLRTLPRHVPQPAGRPEPSGA